MDRFEKIILEEKIVRLGLVHNPRVPCSWLVIVYEKRRVRDRENYRDRDT